MAEILYQLSSVSSFTELLQYGGLALIFLIIFLETAVILGVLVPGGDTLLVTVGLLCSSKILPFELPVVILTMILAAVTGDIVGYLFGRGVSAKLLQHHNNWFLKPRHIEKANRFYEQNSSLTFIAGRFLPVIRTFNPMLSGTSGMKFSRFCFFSLLSSSLWVLSLVLTSYYAGSAFPQLTSYLHYLIPVVILLSAVPLLWQYASSKFLQKVSA